MSEAKAYSCDAPGCDVWRPGKSLGNMWTFPDGWLQLWNGSDTWHFHSASCLARFAETLPQATEEPAGTGTPPEITAPKRRLFG